MIHTLEHVGHKILDRLEAFGIFVLFVKSTFGWLLRGIKQWLRPHLLFTQFYAVGNASVPVVMLVGLFIGMVLAIETYSSFANIGKESRIGGVISVSVVKQIGPVLAAVMLAGRVGGSISAQLGSMRVTEQLDAMKVMGVDPIAYLVVPRVVACVLMIPLLTIFSDLLGIFGSYAVTVWGYGMGHQTYWDFAARFIANYDIFVGLIKSLFFGLAIGLISCFKGFHCQSGAAGVGRAATESFVTCFLAIIVINFFLAMVLNNLYILLYGSQGMGAFNN